MSIEAMMERYGDGVLRLCLLYLGDRQLAEDAFQETFVKAWRQQAAFRGESSEKTWLHTIAANTCRSMLRSGFLRMRRKCRSVDELLDLPAPQKEDNMDVTRAVCALPGTYREVVVLHYYEGMKLREMADLLGMPMNTVSTRLRRARALLRDALGEEVDA